MLTPLFGGAMAAAIPQGFDDCSAFRHVPDNQEVFTHVDTGTSLIIELMSRQKQVDNSSAGAFFFNDLAESNQSQRTEIIPSGPGGSMQVDLDLDRDAPGIAVGGRCAFGTVAHGTQLISKYTNEHGKENEVFVALAVLRFSAPIATEILVSVSSPQSISRGSSEERVVEALVTPDQSLGLLRDVVRSLTVNDYGLFVPEDE